VNVLELDVLSNMAIHANTGYVQRVKFGLLLKC